MKYYTVLLKHHHLCRSRLAAVQHLERVDNGRSSRALGKGRHPSLVSHVAPSMSHRYCLPSSANSVSAALADTFCRVAVSVHSGSGGIN